MSTSATPNPRVGAVILNWNGGADTLRCIAAAQRVGYSNLRIIVVDNGSTDDSVNRIRASTPGVELITSAVNTGFGAGNNLGIAAAIAQGADYVWIINNDIDFEPGTLTELVRVASSIDADIVGSWMFDQTRTVSLFCRNATPRAYFSSRSLSPKRAQEDFWPTFEVSGAAVLLSRRLLQRRFESLGYYLDPSLFLYCEEFELAMWRRANGFHAVTSTRARVYHRVGASTRRLTTPTRQHYLVRNRVVVLRRYLGGVFGTLAATLFACGTLYRGLRNPSSLPHLLRSINAGFARRSGKYAVADDH
jgi:hypothetical protein